MPESVNFKMHMDAVELLKFGRAQVKAALRQAGREVAARAHDLIKGAAGDGKKSHHKRAHTASAPGQPPANDTGLLAGSLKVAAFKSGMGVFVKDLASYALPLEAGARGGVSSGRRGIKGRANPSHWRDRFGKAPIGIRIMAPRPFLSRALQEMRPDIEKRLGPAIEAGVKFVVHRRP